MEMPVDVKKLLDEVSAVDEARAMPISVSVYFDESAPGDLQAFARQAFASASAQARVSLMYLDGRPFTPFEGDDMAAIVAGGGSRVGECAEAMREMGIPVMVVSADAYATAQAALDSGHAIPSADLLSPDDAPKEPAASVVAKGMRNVAGAASALQDKAGALQGVVGGVGRATSTAADFVAAFGEDQKAVAASPAMDGDASSPLTSADAESLSRRMGYWVAEACRDKRLAFALAFPFVRKPLALDAVSATSLQNAGVGAVLFIPGADMPVMTLNQAKMLLQIAAAYGQDLGPARIKELAVVVGGAFACRSAARQIVSVVPVGGWAVKAAIGYSGTYAMGRAAIEYFEGDASLSRFANAATNARNTVLKVAAGKAAEAARGKGASTASAVRDAALGALGSAADRVIPGKKAQAAQPQG